MGILKIFLSYFKLSFSDFLKVVVYDIRIRWESQGFFVPFNSVSNFVPLVIHCSCLASGFISPIRFLGAACNKNDIKMHSFIPQILIAC